MKKNIISLFLIIVLLPSLIKSTENVYLDKSKVYNAKKLKKLSKQQHDQLKKQKKRIMIAVSVGIVVGIIILLIYIYRSRTASVPLLPNADDNTDLVPSYDYKNLQELDLIAYTNDLDVDNDIDLAKPYITSLNEAVELNEAWSAPWRFRITDIIFHKNGNSIAYVQGYKKLIIMDLMQDESTGNTQIKVVKKRDILVDYPSGARDYYLALHLFAYDDEKLLFSDGHRLMQMSREEDELKTIYTFDFPNTKTIKRAYETEEYIYGYYDERSSRKNEFGYYPGIFRLNKKNHDDLILFDIDREYPAWSSNTRYRTHYFVKLYPDNPDYLLMVDLYNEQDPSLVSLWNIATKQKIFEEKNIQFCHIDDQCTSMITFDGAEYTLWSIQYDKVSKGIKVEKKITQPSLLRDSEYTYQSHTVTPDGHLLFVSSYSPATAVAKIEVMHTASLEIMKSFEHTLGEEKIKQFRREYAENHTSSDGYSPLQNIVNIGISPSSEYLFSLLVTKENHHDSYIKIDKMETFLNPDTQPYASGEGEYELSSRLVDYGGWFPYHFLISPTGDFIVTDDETKCFLFLRKTR